MTSLEIHDLYKRYGHQEVLRGLSLSVQAGSFAAILGPSGSGKTTLLRVIAGFEHADRGDVRLGVTVVDDGEHFVPPERRRIGYVPQEGALFPHLSVAQNVAFGLPRAERRGRNVRSLLEMVGLGELGRRYPHQLSGGQQQRVALARALAIRPALVLLDEPFSSLDASLRASVRADVRRVLRDAGTTALLVTHDQEEALSLADQVAVIRDGIIGQVDTPEALYHHPGSPELARALGETNLLSGTACEGGAETFLGRLALEGTGLSDGTALVVLVRPEQLELAEPGEGVVRAVVRESEFHGHDAVVRVDPESGAPSLVVRTVRGTDTLAAGTVVGLRVTGRVVYFAEHALRAAARGTGPGAISGHRGGRRGRGRGRGQRGERAVGEALEGTPVARARVRGAARGQDRLEDQGPSA